MLLPLPHADAVSVHPRDRHDDSFAVSPTLSDAAQQAAAPSKNALPYTDPTLETPMETLHQHTAPHSEPARVFETRELSRDSCVSLISLP